MTGRKRVLTALAHKEPDLIPFDLGGTLNTGIHRVAYERLLRYLGLEHQEVRVCDLIQQLAEVDEKIREEFKVDVQGVFADSSVEMKEEERGWSFFDPWGVKWLMPRKGGLYFDMVYHPLSHATSWIDIRDYDWPDPDKLVHIKAVKNSLRKARSESDRAVVLHLSEGIMERAAWLMGYERFYIQLARNSSLVLGVISKVLECKMALWEQVLNGVEDCVDIIAEADDLATQKGPMIAPAFYRKNIKPLHKELFTFLHKRAPHARLFFHTCGSVYDFIPDLIDVGVDILNPVQVSAAKMDTKVLKKEFGNDLCFWGGGVDTQRILPRGSPEEVKAEVKRRIEDLAPGGGFVFATVHNIQADVPAENIIAMYQTLREYGVYGT
mgnify:CR=1 FL=1